MKASAGSRKTSARRSTQSKPRVGRSVAKTSVVQNANTGSISNAKVAQLLRRYAAALKMAGEGRFKINAYLRAAETIEVLHEPVAALVQRGEDLRTLPAIGAGLSAVISEIVGSGTFAKLDAATAGMAPEIAELAARPGLDPKRVARIYKKLDIHSLDELQSRLDSGDIEEHFGHRMAFHIRQGLDLRPRMLLKKAELSAAAIEHFLRDIPDVARVARVGSLRRKLDTVGDLNFLVETKRPAAVFASVGQFGAVDSWNEESNARASFRFASGGSMTVACTSPQTWGVSLAKETGSAQHLHDLREHARQAGTALAARSLRSAGINTADETAVYRGLGLDFIEPELREGRGEIAAAGSGALPKLIERDDIRGDLHMHTTASDGANSIQEMAEAARAIGYEYIAITDHSQSLKLTNGLSERRLLQQIKRIDRLNAASKDDFVILKSAEVDILEDGRLDYPHNILKELDCTICSIHSRFALDRERQTERIMRAMDNRHFNILGHTTGRLLLSREGYEVDIERLIGHARSNGCYFEINSSPNRLDLSDEHAKLAKQAGVRIAVNTDAHSIRELDFLEWGLNQARRGWLEPADVLNALPLPALKRALAR